MNEHFIILGLPRSMTAWVSCFLTCGDVFCQHELVDHYPIEEALEKIPQPFAIYGACDSGMLFFQDHLLERFPNANYIWIERPSEQCEESFIAAIGISREAMRLQFECWQQEKSNFFVDADPKIFYFDELQTEEGARRLWEYVAPSVPLPPAHLAKMLSLKVVVHPKVYTEAANLLNSLCHTEQ